MSVSLRKVFLNKVTGIITFCCLCVVIYSNTFYSPFQFDDEPSIVINFSIRKLTNLKAVWDFWPTRFITYLSLAFNYHLSHLNVLSYHLFNIIVHLGSAILFWQLVLLTFSTPELKDKKIAERFGLIAFLAGLIFVAHPIQTQAVTYIIQRATSLASFFYLATLNLYVKSVLLEKIEKKMQDLPASKIYYAASLITTVLAMFTKEMAITLPFAILLYEFCFLKTGKGIRWRRLVPFLLTLLIIPLTMWFTKSVNFLEMRMASESSPHISPLHYLLTEFRVMVTYIRLVFVPLNQNLDYDYPIAKNLLSLPVLASILFLVLIIVIAAKIFSRYRLVSFGIFWFFLTLLPESSIVPIRDVIFEHRLYLPMVGFSVFLISSVYYLFERNFLRSLVLIPLILTISYSLLAYQRNYLWKDEFTLWNDTVSKSPNKARPYNNRGNTYKQQGNIVCAIYDYDKAIQINPNYAKAYNNRGHAYQLQGNLVQAISDYNKAIETYPNLYEAIYNLGNVYIVKADFGQAILDFDRVIKLNPNYAQAYNNRGIAYSNKGNFDSAISDYNKAIEINPNLVEAYINRGNAYGMKGNLTQAILDFNRAIKINPDSAEAYYNRGNAHFLRKEYDKSWEDMRRAEELGLKPNTDFIRDLKKLSDMEE